MYIKELILKNFRSAKNLTLELDEKINVFVGVNGAGKSTVLAASTILLAEIIRKINPYDTSIRFSKSNINNNSIASTVSMTLVESAKAYKVELGIVKNSNDFLTHSNEMDFYFKAISEEIGKNPQGSNIPLFTYYPVGRVVHETPLKVKGEHEFSLFDAYEDCLDNTTSFKAFFQWFRLREDLENENTRRAKVFTTDKQLDFVRHALSVFLPQFTELYILRNPLSMVAKKDDEIININQLSDGEKCLLVLIGDLARRLAIANPLRENPLQGEGIVLIDEIDLHLHPTWQQMIIPKLLETFPNCQFLISTHSPHVLTHVKPDNVFLLENTENGLVCEQPRYIYGRTSESILQAFMGLENTRPKNIADELQQIFVDIQEKKLDKAQEAIDNLVKEIGDDPELVKARALIRRMEAIGK